jgi:hypothetical protein
MIELRRAIDEAYISILIFEALDQAADPSCYFQSLLGLPIWC